MKNDEEILQSLIAGGLIGAALGALVSNNKEEGATLGALAGAVLLATFKANEQAMKSNIAMYVQEGGSLFEIQPGGTKQFVKEIKKNSATLPQHFKLQ
ncbi:MAG: glycine zipper 2TM domain-containing protein [Chitinophagaceae bacterium]